jgi:hypothetical protein
MIKNVGSADRILRTVAALVLVALIIAGAISGTVAIALTSLAVILLLTSGMAFCPLYYGLKINTNKKIEKV